jgi:GNAT superfamily N-acetyltransferase
MQRSDVAATASIHHETMPEVFVTRIGPRALMRYHRAFAESPFAAALVAEATPDPAAGNHASGVGPCEIAGFLLGAIDPPRHYRYMLRHHGLAMAFLVSSYAATHPSLALELLRTRARRYASGLARMLARSVSQRLRRMASSPPTSSATAGKAGSVFGSADGPVHGDAQTAELVDVAVLSRYRSHGYGARLVEAFEAAARRGGASFAELVTPPGESGAGKFYDRLGWQQVRELTSRSAESFVLYRRVL